MHFSHLCHTGMWSMAGYGRLYAQNGRGCNIRLFLGLCGSDRRAQRLSIETKSRVVRGTRGLSELEENVENIIRIELSA
jgi:hypothetical protein